MPPPPLMQQVQNAVISFFSTGDQRNEQQRDPNAARDKEDDHDDIEEVGSIVTSGGKRPRRGNHGDSERAVKRRVPSAHESRLTENFTPTPKDAITIGFPAYDANEDWNPPPQRAQQTKMAAGQRKGSFRPQNTLGKGTPQSGKSNGNSGSNRPFEPYTDKTLDGRKLQTETSRGSNVARKADFPNDNVSTMARPYKRQKTNQDISSVDLTKGHDDDDSYFAKPIRRDGREPPATTSASGFRSRPQMQSEISSSHEQHSVDEMLEVIEIPKNERPNTNGNLSSRASAKGSERGRSMNGESRRDLEKKTSPIVLIEDETHWTSVRSNAVTRDSHPQAKPRRPPIELDKGFDQVDREYYAKRGQARGGLSQGINDLENGTRRNTATGQLRTSQQKVEPPSERIANTSRREGDSQKKANASAQMQKNGRHSLTSDDELSGAKTVVSASSRHASPHKPPSARSVEPSSIRPTPFTRAGILLADAQLRKVQAASRKNYIEDDGDTRIPIRAIFCKACVLVQNGLELVWDSSLSAFIVICQKQKLRTPNMNSFVKIGAAEVSSWLGATDTPRVCLQGPSSDISTGMILIEFEDLEGISECDRSLRAVIPTLQQRRASRDHIDKVFDKQAAEMQQAHERAKDQAMKPRRSIQENRVRREIRQPDEEETIVYETEEQPQIRRPKAHERMQGGGGYADELSEADIQESREKRQPDEHVSKYFPDSGPRRSGRQSKPVQIKERSPSPERWTRTNSVKRWTHSVVYPEMGLRRVTVDFQDLERLDEGEFLNDNVVNFELRRIEENMAPEHRAKVHFFNTFFFSSLSQKNGKKTFNYDAVSRWTKKIDLFNVPYVVVPINVQLHWFVAIICNLPNIPRQFNGFGDVDEGGDEKPSTTNSIDGQEDQAEEQVADVQIAAEGSANANSSPKSDVFAFGDDGKVVGYSDVEAEQAPSSSRPTTATGNKGKKKSIKPSKKYDPSKPIIMSLDSFNITRSAEIKYLKLYVSAEAMTKREMDLDYSDLQGMSAKGIPEQPNFCDCGVYLLGYVAEFAKDPDAFVRKVLTREMDRDNDFAGFDASAKRCEIRDELLKLQETQESERIAQKKAKQAAKAGKTTTSQTTQVPADASKETRVPSSAAQPENESVKPNASQENAPHPYKIHPQNGARSEDPASNDEDNDLEVEPPSFIGQSNPKTPISNAADDGNDDEHDEMLFDGVNDGEEDEAAEESRPKRARSPGVFEKEQPVPPSSAAAKGSTPMRNLESWAHADDSERPERPEPEGPDIIDIGVSEDEGAAAEIPDSQEETQPPRRTGRHTKCGS